MSNQRDNDAAPKAEGTADSRPPTARDWREAWRAARENDGAAPPSASPWSPASSTVRPTGEPPAGMPSGPSAQRHPNAGGAARPGAPVGRPPDPGTPAPSAVPTSRAPRSRRSRRRYRGWGWSPRVRRSAHRCTRPRRTARVRVPLRRGTGRHPGRRLTGGPYGRARGRPGRRRRRRGAVVLARGPPRLSPVAGGRRTAVSGPLGLRGGVVVTLVAHGIARSSPSLRPEGPT